MKIEGIFAFVVAVVLLNIARSVFSTLKADRGEWPLALQARHTRWRVTGYVLMVGSIVGGLCLVGLGIVLVRR